MNIKRGCLIKTASFVLSKISMESNERTKTCQKCKQLFACYSGGCWCGALPRIFPLDANKDCYCPSCLKLEVQQKIDRTLAHLTLDECKKIKNLGEVQNPVEGVDFYINENGYHVFTQWYHLRRGTCCGNGCKHCPYHKSLLVK